MTDLPLSDSAITEPTAVSDTDEVYLLQGGVTKRANVSLLRAGLMLATARGAANGVASLGADSKLPAAQLPPEAIITVTDVASQAAMLALTAQAGDIAIRLDVSKAFILRTTPASTLANWVELPSGSAAAFIAHLAETDPHVHNASKVASDSSVGTGNVEDDLSSLESSKADGVLVAGIAGALGGLPGGLEGPGARSLYQEEFWGSEDVTTSGKIGLTGWRRQGGSSALIALSAFRPGGVRISTGAVADTYTSLYAAVGGMFNPSATFDFYMWARALNYDNSITIRIGLTSDGASETPTDGVFLEKLATETAVWHIVTRIASVQVRTPSVVLPAANQFIRLRIRRVNSTDVGFSVATNVGPEAPEQIMPFASNVHLVPFFAIKNASAVTRTGDIDRCQLALGDLLR